MSSERPSVAVVIPALNAEDRLELAVHSVLAQDVPPDVVAVVLGPSQDGTTELAKRLAKEHDRIRLVDNPSGRTPQALNAGIEATKSDVVVRVDAGSILPPSYISRALETMKQTGAANVGAIQTAVGTSPFERAVAAATTSKFGMGGVAYRTGDGEPRPVDTAYLGVFRRDALLEVGGYDERFTRNQDAELNWRLQEVDGGVWLDPMLHVDYQPRSSLRSLISQYFQYGRWRARTIAKHPTSLQPRQLAAPTLVSALGLSSLLAVAGRATALRLLTAVYGTAVGAATLRAPGDLTVAERLRLVMIFPSLHLSWGSGVLSTIGTWITRR